MNWIKASERQPEITDLPIWTCREGDERSFVFAHTVVLENDILWCTIPEPKPPAKPTQEELDSRAMLTAWKRQGIDYAYDRVDDIPLVFQDGWSLALKYSRGEKQELL